MPYAETTPALCHPDRRRKTAAGLCDTCYRHQRQQDDPDVRRAARDAKLRYRAKVATSAELVDTLNVAIRNHASGRPWSPDLLRGLINELEELRGAPLRGIRDLVDGLTATRGRQAEDRPPSAGNLSAAEAHHRTRHHGRRGLL